MSQIELENVHNFPNILMNSKIYQFVMAFLKTHERERERERERELYPQLSIRYFP